MKNIDLNNSDNLQQLQSEMNTVFEERILKAKINECLANVSAMPFNTLKSLFEMTTDKIFETKDGKSLIKKYAKAIRESKDAKLMYSICELIKSPSANRNSEAWASEIISLTESIDIKEVKKCKEVIGGIVTESLKKANVNIEEIKNCIESTRVLGESIEGIASIGGKKSATNLSDYVEKASVIRENVNSVSIGETQPAVVVNESVKDMVSKLTSVDREGLESWENSTVDDIILAKIGGNTKALFEEYKTRCISTIDEMVESTNIEEKSRLSLMKEQLENKNFSEETFTEDILNLSKLQHALIN